MLDTFTMQSQNETDLSWQFTCLRFSDLQKSSFLKIRMNPPFFHNELSNYFPVEVQK
jgi:hypothetical protein